MRTDSGAGAERRIGERRRRKRVGRARPPLTPTRSPVVRSRTPEFRPRRPLGRPVPEVSRCRSPLGRPAPPVLWPRAPVFRLVPRLLWPSARVCRLVPPVLWPSAPVIRLVPAVTRAGKEAFSAAPVSGSAQTCRAPRNGERDPSPTAARPWNCRCVGRGRNHRPRGVTIGSRPTGPAVSGEFSERPKCPGIADRDAHPRPYSMPASAGESARRTYGRSRSDASTPGLPLRLFFEAGEAGSAKYRGRAFGRFSHGRSG